MYKVVAQLEHSREDGWSRSVQIPTFFLDENVQGIVNEQHCLRIVCDMLNPFDDDNIVVHASIMKES